jgi:hypothetical protein
MHLTEDELNDYVDGLLSPAERETMERHLATCSLCTAELEQVQLLLVGLGSLSKVVPPGEDLLPGIHARIAGAPGELHHRALWTARRPLAAAAVVLLLASSATTVFLSRGGSPPHPPAAAAPSVPLVGGGVAFAQFRVLEAEYVRAADELRKALERQEGVLDPATAEALERNLRIIDQAIRESRAALLADPNSEMLQQMLLTTYERKLDILRRVETLSANS